MKFLMSQRQSDLSSVGGFSNVESGSQPDDDRTCQRRGSVNSNVSGTVSAEEARIRNSGALFSKSLDVLSGSTETITSSQGGFKDTAADLSKTSSEFQQSQGVSEARESMNSSNSISFLNKPLDKVGFVTLENLMKGDNDIGKLLNKSLESIEKGTIPEGASPLLKQASNESQLSRQSGDKQAGGVRERRDSSFSISSDGGSDSERRKVSMKYMGTLPEGINYESFVKQMSAENKNKSLMFTFFSSPEVNSQLKRTPDAGLKTPPIQKILDSPIAEAGYKSDTNSNRTLTDLNEIESQSAVSTFSLGEHIKRICDGQSQISDQRLDIQTPRTGTDTVDDATPRPSNEKEKLESDIKVGGVCLANHRESPVKDCSVILKDCVANQKGEGLSSTNNVNKRETSPKTISHDAGSPGRKRLKSKKERDQMSRRKQKESFILPSDTNSEGENGSTSSVQKTRLSPKLTIRSEEEIVLSGSEDITPRPVLDMDRKKSLLDEVQLETPSDSCEDKINRAAASTGSSIISGRDTSNV